MKFLVVNGPNINMTGIREQGVYGARNYTEIMAMIAAEAKQRGIEVEVFQSNIEGEMINAIQRCYFEHMDGLIINPGAYTHTSYALHDAIKSIAPIPAVEVHFSMRARAFVMNRKQRRLVSVSCAVSGIMAM